MDTKYISVDETTALLNLSNRRVRQLITNGEITALKDKNKWRIDIEELMNSELFLRKSTGNASGTQKEPLRQVSGNASGTTTSNPIIGSKIVGFAFLAASLNAIDPAILNAISLESTS